jgi:ferredoxin
MDIKSLFIKPSTQAFVDEAKKIKGYSFVDLLHGYIYARWPYLYIGIGTGEHPLSKAFAPIAGFVNRLITHHKPDESAQDQIGFADTYHGKAVPLEIAKKLVMVNEEINIPDLEQVIPYKRARSIILKNPDHIVALDCPCRVSRKNPCLPLDVCLVVGEPFVSFVLEHQTGRSRRITQEEAVNILKAEDERGHVHHVFFKDAMLDRFYAICNCCSCCCGAMQAQRNGIPMLASSGYVTQVDEDLCIGCGDCGEYCQFGALSVKEYVNFVDEEKCMGCGVCISKCTQEALSLRREPTKGEPLEILALMEEAVSLTPLP